MSDSTQPQGGERISQKSLIEWIEHNPHPQLGGRMPYNFSWGLCMDLRDARAEVTQLKDAVFAHRINCQERDAFYAGLETEVSRLRGAMEKYGRHGHNGGDICDRSKHSEWACTCGFESVMAEAPPVAPASPSGPAPDLSPMEIEGLACLAALKIDLEPRLKFLTEYNRMKAEPEVIAWLRQQIAAGKQLRDLKSSGPGIPDNSAVVKDSLTADHITEVDKMAAVNRAIDEFHDACMEMGSAEVYGQKVEIAKDKVNLKRNVLITALGAPAQDSPNGWNIKGSATDNRYAPAPDLGNVTRFSAPEPDCVDERIADIGKHDDHCFIAGGGGGECNCSYRLGAPDSEGRGAGK